PEPPGQLPPQDGERVRVLAVAQVLVVDADGRVRRHDPAPFLNDRTLERRLLPCVAYDLLEGVAVENPAHDILGARLAPALEESDLEAGFGHRERGCGSRRPGANHH